MNKFRDVMNLLRWQNVLMTGVVVYVMEKWVATPLLCSAYFGEQLPWWVLALLILSTALIAAGGYVINDYFDVKIDAINRPDKLIVTRGVSKAGAMRLFQVLTAVGVICGLVAAAYLRSWVLAVIFIFVPGLLWFYSASYKRLFLIGNLIVALAAALTPLVVPIANIDYITMRYGDILPYTTLRHDLLLWVGAFAAFAFWGTLIREIIKDLQDHAGDRELECHTLPIVLGEKAAKVVALVLLVLMTAAIVWIAFWVIPFPHEWQSLHARYIVLGLIVPIACEIYLLIAARIPSDYRVAQTVMKFVLLMGVLYSYVINSYLG